MDAKHKVLVIDDDADLLEFVRIILEANDYDVFTALNAEEGLELARKVQPDVALVDVMMSYILDGLNLIQTMRADPKTAHIPIVLISAIISADADGFLPPGQHLECDAFMSKPIAPQALLDQIRQLIAKSDTGNDQC